MPPEKGKKIIHPRKKKEEGGFYNDSLGPNVKRKGGSAWFPRTAPGCTKGKRTRVAYAPEQKGGERKHSQRFWGKKKEKVPLPPSPLAQNKEKKGEKGLN